jgi:hypothetical protein
MERNGAGQMNGEALEHADTWAVETFGKVSILRCVFLRRDVCKNVSATCQGSCLSHGVSAILCAREKTGSCWRQREASRQENDGDALEKKDGKRR